jgi:predicted ATPase
LLEQKRRFVTIIGQSGMGKSTLARELVRYIQFRNYFKDGVVYLELSRCEGMAKIYEVLDLELFETPQLRLNKTPGENANRLVKELGEQSVLLVLDNCHSIMGSEERESFKRLV